MFIEAITVCVNYGDFLAHTLPHNKKHFNNYVIVTSTTDKFTKKICDFYEVQCIQTDIFYQDDHQFNKGRGINEGLKKLKMVDWVLHLDADIFLLPHFKTTMKEAELNEESIYSVDRLMCNSFEDWIDFLSNPVDMYNGITNEFKIGTRLVNERDRGYLPLGYFQMWNPKASMVNKYPTKHQKADYSDLQFSNHWSRSKRKLIPDTFVVHLDSQSSEMGENWGGRKTPIFGKSKLDVKHPHNKQKNSYEK